MSGLRILVLGRSGGVVGGHAFVSPVRSVLAQQRCSDRRSGRRGAGIKSVPLVGLTTRLRFGLVLPDEMERWSLTTLREKVVMVGAKVIAHARYAIFHVAEVAVPRDPFRDMLERIGGLRPPPPTVSC